MISTSFRDGIMILMNWAVLKICCAYSRRKSHSLLSKTPKSKNPRLIKKYKPYHLSSNPCQPTSPLLIPLCIMITIKPLHSLNKRGINSFNHLNKQLNCSLVTKKYKKSSEPTTYKCIEAYGKKNKKYN